MLGGMAGNTQLVKRKPAPGALLVPALGYLGAFNQPLLTTHSSQSKHNNTLRNVQSSKKPPTQPHLLHCTLT